MDKSTKIGVFAAFLAIVGLIVEGVLPGSVGRYFGAVSEYKEFILLAGGLLSGWLVGVPGAGKIDEIIKANKPNY